ncbi:AT-rich interactive domain-containing protein 3A [Leopardus geoffroyi]|uniref:AT-rich interactive domain-containing protein 3A n=1 Tax=Leopardus geoffroyi TaxID=46844 RepID=UPI001E26190B|nr:AT-rich interactive domain-containing protein 3A [Leopardus geoffroyi]XP_045347103.1 AT-rich interactive domain-containing protein 3A [Leopardus geoffroyi]XP_045347104.1 AT-rich interactive domain-containing protein 3A [Leopardus geoffroyi]XP_045347105.1 AT-rich interactive domain-containing protein 3A [Leopardus geoffroyi]XP_045347106.1 AT-rich interactive domain-containing protein 3A [Leopardus geoffroyi]XP_045347107.1 AT-rich interactive domain-containing protein 3A [Leopardus geoffroyi]
MKLQAVMETLLQRQQRARQELEARQPPPPLPPELPAGPPARARAAPDEDREPEKARMQRAQMAALAAMRAAAAGLGHPPSPGGSEDGPPGLEDEDTAREGAPGSPAAPGRGREAPGRAEGDERLEDAGSDGDLKPKWEEEEEEEELEEELDEEEDEEEEDEEDEDEEAEYEDEEGLGPPGSSGLGPAALIPRRAPPSQAFRGDGGPRVLGSQERPGAGLAHAGGAAHVAPQLQPPDHGDWTYEEQFKQLYELDGDPKRKEFLDDLFSFMQKRGTPVNRIPIMAKQVLDLFMLYVLVTEKGGLVEVINKKLWREITKGLNLPTSITSAAFTLRTQYMKYLYPYECEKRGLSNPNELQAAIDSNRREGRRQSFGGSLFAYSPGGAHGMLSSPKLPVPSLGLAASTNGSSITPAPKIKKEEDSAIPITVPGRLPVSLAGHPVVAAQAAAVQAAAAQAAVAAQAAALEQLREKLESGEPPEKKMALVTEEQQRLVQRALQQNFLAMTAQLPMSIRINSQACESRQDSAANLTSPNGSNSISMSVEINGIMYTGVLFAQPPSAPSKGGGGGSRGGTSGTTSSSSSSSSSSSTGSQAGPAGLSTPATSSTSNNSLP